jgi:hypothetical protein
MSKSKLSKPEISSGTQFNIREIGCTLTGLGGGILLGYAMFNDTHLSFAFASNLALGLALIGGYLYSKHRSR